MKKYQCFPLVILIILALNLSCKKYLDEKSDASLVVPSTLADFQNLMDDGGTMNVATPGIGTASADDYFIDVSAYNSKAVFQQHVYKWMPYPYRYSNDWALTYKAIYVANLCLERIVLVARDTANAAAWDHMKGAALFYKAFYELEMAWLFAKAYDPATAERDMGIVIRTGTDFTVRSERASVAATYATILQQAKAAAYLLPDKAIFATRASKGAAYGLLARTYLSMRQYDSAGKYANLALGLNNVLMNYNEASLVSLNSSAPFKLFNREVIFHSTMGSSITLHHPSNGPARIDTALYTFYDANDLRRKAFFVANSGYQRFKGSYSGNNSRLFSGIATDEMLLMRAECYARAGDKTAALQDLNMLLEARFLTGNFIPVTASNSQGALDIILQERRKELIFRGSLRWMDVKRLNKEGREITMKRKIGTELFSIPPNDDRFALQIPADVIELSGIQQN